MAVSRRSVSSQAKHHARMLDGSVLVVELRSHRTHIFSLSIHQKLLDPVRRNDLRIIVQKKHILSGRLRDAQIVDPGIVKFSLIGDDPDRRIFLYLSVIGKDFLCDAVILYHDDLIIVVGAPLRDRGNTSLQILQMILIGNHDGYPGIPQDLILDLKDRLKGLGGGDLKIPIALSREMGRHRPLSRLNGIALRIDVQGHAPRMGSPVIIKLRHMHHTLGAGGEPQDHIVVLAAVKLGAEQLRPVQKPSGKGAEMTDIIISPQIVRCVVRLEVQSDHVVDGTASLKRCLITIDVVRSLLTDRLHILVENAGMQHIIMVKKRYIVTGGHGQTSIRIAGYSFIFRKLFIEDPAIETAAGAQVLLVLLHIFSADLLHIGVLLVGAVSQTQLPIFIGLTCHRLDGLSQKLLRGIVKGHENAELHFFIELIKPLSRRLLKLRETCSAVLCPRLFLDHLGVQLAGNSLQASVVSQTLLRSDQLVCQHTKGLGQPPGETALDAHKPTLRLLPLPLRLRQFFRDRAAAAFFPLIGLFIKAQSFLFLHILPFHK